MTIASVTAARIAAVALMVGTFVAAGAMLSQPELRASPAYVDEDRRAIGSTERGRLARMDVTVGETVRAGDVIARLETTVIDGELAALEAEAATLSNRARARASSASRANASLRARADEARGAAAARSTAAGALRAAIEEIEAQIARGLAAGRDLPSLRAELSSAEADARALQATASSLEAANLAAPAELSADEAGQAEVEALRLRVEALRLRRDTYELRAPVDGRVAAVLRRAGDAIEPGDIVVELVANRANRAIACLDARDAARLVPDQAALVLVSRDEPPISGRVTAIGPAFQQADPRCRMGLFQPAWVLPVTVLLSDGERLVPGAPLQIRWLDELATGVGPEAHVEQGSP